MFKLLALDLDGTLLNSNHEISERNIRTIRKINERGIIVILASGRELGSINLHRESLNLDTLMAGINGTIIGDGNGRILKDICLSEEEAKGTIFTSEEAGLFPIGYIRDKILVGDVNNPMYSYFKKFTLLPIIETDCLSDYLEENKLWTKLNKISITSSNERLKDNMNKLRSNVNKDTNLLFSLPTFIEVFSGNASKGKAIEYIANYYGIKAKEVISIGDGENDIAMLKYAGIGIAMGNAPDSVKQQADHITLTNDDDGVSHIIEQYILN